MMNERHEAAREYHRMKLPITLCHGKQPIDKGWQNKIWTLKEIDQRFRVQPDLNVGTRLGHKLIDFDADSPQAELAMLELFDGDVPITPTFKSKRGRHWLMRPHPDLEKIGKATIHFGPLEIRIGANGKACQTLLPPSTTDGIRREWLVSLEECDPVPMPKAALRRLFDKNGAISTAVVEVEEGDQPNTERTESTEITESTDDMSLSSLSSLSSLYLISDTSSPAADDLERAVALTLPRSHGHRHRALFEFARRLKAIPGLAGADLRELRPYVKVWHARALPYMETKDFDETWLDFAEGWGKVLFPAGQEPIRMIYEEALSKPLPRAAEQYEAGSLRRLVALCRELQYTSGDKPFYLACRTAGTLLGITHTLANKWLRLLVMDGVLEITKKGSQLQATRYRYKGD